MSYYKTSFRKRRLVHIAITPLGIVEPYGRGYCVPNISHSQQYYIPGLLAVTYIGSTSFLARKEVMTIAAIIKNEDKDSMHVVTRFIL